MISVLDMAKAVHLRYGTYYYWTFYRGAIPLPTVRLGQRLLYTDADLATCQAAVDRLRADGSLRRGTVKADGQ